MEIAELKATYTEARAKVAEYRAAVRQRQNNEDETLRATYQAIVMGKRVIDVRAAFRDAGLDPRGRPLLAIARADRERCIFGIRRGRWWFISVSESRWHEPRAGDTSLPLSAFTMSAPTRRWYDDHELRAVVPLIPPALRPAHRLLSKYHILWEADWEAVPTDPILLRRIRGPMFAIVAQWDLTDVEKAVLAGRIR